MYRNRFRFEWIVEVSTTANTSPKISSIMGYRRVYNIERWIIFFSNTTSISRSSIFSTSKIYPNRIWIFSHQYPSSIIAGWILTYNTIDPSHQVETQRIKCSSIRATIILKLNVSFLRIPKRNECIQITQKNLFVVQHNQPRQLLPLDPWQHLNQWNC